MNNTPVDDLHVEIFRGNSTEVQPEQDGLLGRQTVDTWRGTHRDVSPVVSVRVFPVEVLVFLYIPELP